MKHSQATKYLSFPSAPQSNQQMEGKTPLVRTMIENVTCPTGTVQKSNAQKHKNMCARVYAFSLLNSTIKKYDEVQNIDKKHVNLYDYTNFNRTHVYGISV